METKTVNMKSDILKGVSYRAKMEDVDENTAINQLVKLGVMCMLPIFIKSEK